MTPAGGMLSTTKSQGSMMGMRFRWVRRTTDIHDLARSAADEVLRLSHEAIAERGVFRIALAGGSTPRTPYEIIARSTTARFDRWHFYWGDERCVPPDHADSNFLMAQQTLLGNIAVSEHQLHRIRTEVGSPAQVAADYEDDLRYSFQLAKDELPCFDCIILGLGEDGHTASLFPGSPALDERERLVVANKVRDRIPHRVTLSLPVLNAARAVIFVVSGASKADVLREVLADGPVGAELPARRICPSEGTVLWVVDEAAAAALDQEHSGG